MKNPESYVSANAFPYKLMKITHTNTNGIVPVHLQLFPTNRCNRRCGYCSYKRIDRSKELSYECIIDLFEKAAYLGTRAVTISGTGEPLMHPYINEIIKYAARLHLKVGLVTNGEMLRVLEPHNNIAWCRVSYNDGLSLSEVEKGMEKNPYLDWAFSYVVTMAVNYAELRELIRFANEKEMTHVRVISDILDLDNVPEMDEVANIISDVDCKIVEFQDRRQSCRGAKECYLSLLKPVVTPEGIYPCCGCHYAIRGQEFSLPESMRMGSVDSFEDIIRGQKFFDGSICDVCYYSQYNGVLRASTIKRLRHKEFV